MYTILFRNQYDLDFHIQGASCLSRLLYNGSKLAGHRR
jgi:hypothetical protein